MDEAMAEGSPGDPVTGSLHAKTVYPTPSDQSRPSAAGWTGRPAVAEAGSAESGTGGDRPSNGGRPAGGGPPPNAVHFQEAGGKVEEVMKTCRQQG
jgi:hypothetical protein